MTLQSNTAHTKSDSKQDEGKSPKLFARIASMLSSPIDGNVVLGPNWFASVMGTGIIAIAGATLPLHFPGLFYISSAAWMLYVVLLAMLLVVIPMHWIRQPETFKAIASDPILIQFFGAPPMALMTVGTATLLVGSHYVGQSTAVAIDSALWLAGTMLGFITAVVVPYHLVVG